ncbi:26S proteasome non-ATPase regulatory subunit 9 [Rhizophlyctis rosea]|uniref:Probable 26S proteasome regulatory subunit p27 n=1 Tax=Rhizophlyctis rosea TaxID=64517 RepID=A0AAD5SDK0_9FUNG|nr:26S proteasome non-ATPase regulatory subunit 9 [Rhizophlyctis rosea]
MTGATHADLLARAQHLVREKDAIEANIREFEAVLQSQKVGMDDPLVDREGFPRGDVDIYAVRHARTTIIRLRNDLKAKMSEIESALHAVHTQAQLEKNMAGTQPPARPTEDIPFAAINGVAPDSPANEAGLERGDKVVRFGHVDVTNHQGLKALSDLVAVSENKIIRVLVLRDNTPKTLFVTPHKWSGRGMLG